MDRAELDKRIEAEGNRAAYRYREHKGNTEASMCAAVRPLVERIVELEESTAGLVRARIEALTADLDACREIIETRSNALRAAEEGRVLLNAEIDRLEAQFTAAAEHRASLAKEVRGLCLQIVEMERQMEKAGQS